MLLRALVNAVWTSWIESNWCPFSCLFIHGNNKSQVEADKDCRRGVATPNRANSSSWKASHGTTHCHDAVSNWRRWLVRRDSLGLAGVLALARKSLNLQFPQGEQTPYESPRGRQKTRSALSWSCHVSLDWTWGRGSVQFHRLSIGLRVILEIPSFIACYHLVKKFSPVYKRFKTFWERAYTRFFLAGGWWWWWVRIFGTILAHTLCMAKSSWTMRWMLVWAMFNSLLNASMLKQRWLLFSSPLSLAILSSVRAIDASLVRWSSSTSSLPSLNSLVSIQNTGAAHCSIPVSLLNHV